MGSLLPGWDERAPGVAPKEFQDFNEDEDEHMGYFAAYNKMKKEHKALGDLSKKSGPGLLRRQSMPIPRVSDPLAVPTSPHGRLEKSFTFSPRSLDRHSLPAEAPHLQRLGSLPARAGAMFDRGEGSTPRTPKSPTSSFGISGSPTSLDQYRINQDHKHDIQWWRSFDSAHLNEMPDVPVSKDRGYIPQYKTTGQQMHYHMEDQDQVFDADHDGDQDDLHNNDGEVLLPGVDISSSRPAVDYSGSPVSGSSSSRDGSSSSSYLSRSV